MPFLDIGLPEHLKFYDALSGEFRPGYDPRHKFHTLARLAFRALEAGEIVLPELEEGLGSSRSRSALYKPSWAPNVSVVAISETPLVEPHLTDLIMTHQNGSSLRLTEVGLEDDERRHVLINDSGLEQAYPLGSGDEIHIARHSVTRAAESFFA